VTTENPHGSEEDAPLIEPDAPVATPDLSRVDTDRILRETGTISVPAEREEVAPESDGTEDTGETVQETPEKVEEPARTGINVLSVISLILALTLSPFTVIFGYLAVGQARRSHQRGEVLAWVATGFGWLWLVGYVVIGAILFAGWQQVS
jgi:hypothetical protein